MPVNDTDVSKILDALDDLGVKLDGIQNGLSDIKDEMVTKKDAKALVNELKNATFFTFGTK